MYVFPCDPYKASLYTSGCFEPFGSLRATVKVAVEGVRNDAPVEYGDFREEGDDRRVHRLPNLEELELVYIVFDVLFVDDRSVLSLPLSERHKILRSIIKDAPLNGIPMGNGLKGALIPLMPDKTFLGEQCLSKKGASLDDIVEMFNGAISMQVLLRFFDFARVRISCAISKEEGIVVKALDSPWTSNDRSEKWVKMKPDYISNHEIDAVIIGGYYGKGKHTRTVSEFLLGILDTTEREKRYVSFCRSNIHSPLWLSSNWHLSLCFPRHQSRDRIVRTRKTPTREPHLSQSEENQKGA